MPPAPLQNLEGIELEPIFRIHFIKPAQSVIEVHAAMVHEAGAPMSVLLALLPQGAPGARDAAKPYREAAERLYSALIGNVEGLHARYNRRCGMLLELERDPEWLDFLGMGPATHVGIIALLRARPTLRRRLLDGLESFFPRSSRRMPAAPPLLLQEALESLDAPDS